MTQLLFKALFELFDRFAAIILRSAKDPRVCSGPFQRMAYVRGAVGSSLVPKILGTYEREISQWLYDLPHFRVGLDIGAAEGYYAVGLLKRRTCDHVIAWEMNPEGQALMDRMATANDLTGRLDIRGRCDPEQLRTAISGEEQRLLVIVDCEGFEEDLLFPLSDMLLRKCSLFIETHDAMNPGVHQKLRQRLELTHDIVEVFPSRRIPTDLPAELPELLFLFRLPILRRLAMSERRPPHGNGWLLCHPKTD